MNINKFKAKIIEKGYTAEKLAKKLGIGKTSMSYKMNDHKPFNLNEIKLIMNYLGLTNNDMLEIFFN